MNHPILRGRQTADRAVHGLARRTAAITDSAAERKEVPVEGLVDDSSLSETVRVLRKYSDVMRRYTAGPGELAWLTTFEEDLARGEFGQP